MTYDNTNNIDDKNIDTDQDANVNIKPSEEKNPEVRKRIDELLEKKRLKEMLDDTDDWEFLKTCSSIIKIFYPRSPVLSDNFLWYLPPPRSNLFKRY